MSEAAAKKLLKALSKVTGSGRFHSAGREPFFLPGIHVKGVGELAFPVPASQAGEVFAAAKAAPYGQGKRTLLDEEVRKCRQVDAKDLEFRSPEWPRFLKRVLQQVREDLGIPGKISAVPYKLLIYGPGGHFRAHRDTEKLEAMFGTLIVALPSAHEGGRLFIRHNGEEAGVDFSREEGRHSFQHAAFFADCEHEVEPVRSGFRCCLVYNLRLDQGDPAHLNQPVDRQAETLLPSVRELARQRSGRLSAVLLAHSYTETSFSWRNLKGDDLVRARALLGAAEASGLEAHLGLVTLYQMGELEGAGYHWQDDKPGDGEMGEVYEEGLTIEQWRDGRDRPVPLGKYQVDEEDLVTARPLNDGDPDEKEEEGFTGNAGCTMEYWYRRAAVVIWRKEDREEVMGKFDFAGACRMLEELAGREGAAGDFDRLADNLVRRYPESLPHESWFSRDFQVAQGTDRSSDPFAVLLRVFLRTKSRERVEALRNRVPAGAFGLCEEALLQKLFSAFGPALFVPVFETLLAGDPNGCRVLLFRLLAALLGAKSKTVWTHTIAMVLAGLDPENPGQPEGRGIVPAQQLDEARILLLASPVFKTQAERGKALAFLQGDGSLTRIREILAPVLLDGKVRRSSANAGSLFPEVLLFAREALTREVARPLRPYPDWTRAFPDAHERKTGIGGYFWRRPSHNWLAEMKTFLADPDKQSHDFARRQDERSEIENWIRETEPDLEHATIRRGSPHTLRCTKTSRSHDRAVVQRKDDQKLLQDLA